MFRNFLFLAGVGIALVAMPASAAKRPELRGVMDNIFAFLDLPDEVLRELDATNPTIGVSVDVDPQGRAVSCVPAVGKGPAYRVAAWFCGKLREPGRVPFIPAMDDNRRPVAGKWSLYMKWSNIERR
ncbi:MAG: hypothetical protein U0S50_03960 [Sphingopyxis sp.]|uniref:hypothetical protein n=1 Tax=Sphingopyxis sp. TaxID=1908224 RepID=UPI002ABB49D3|nr:hypothetical protein [Sphingopyxis sp.]MDZ3830958.1 hypothetical protein [Sphingopyxis sp.]